MEQAAIVGNGMIGNATGTLFGIEKRFDLDETKTTCSLNDVAHCRYVFICLPTPVKDGDYVVQPIMEMVRQINSIRQGPIFIIRSTVWPGFADHLASQIRPEAVISNPEFLSEDTWEKDIKSPPFVLIGGYDGVHREEVASLYRNVTKHSPIIFTDNATAETAKLALNAFFSTKVIFANQVYDYCQKSGANYQRVREILEKHPYGMKNHTEIFYKEQRGVRGHCLPKDLEAFAAITGSPLLGVVKAINDSTS
jgi:UDPglucose 6-dehydrogenase